MNKLIALGLMICVYALTAEAQNQIDPRKVIEVSGSAERWIVPDEFTFKITLTERIENKQKITIDQQEEALKAGLTKLGSDVDKDLSIYDLSSRYFRQKKVKDVLGSKDYRLMIRDLTKIAPLQDLADQLNVSRLDLIDTDSSKMTQYRRETKMDAIRAAKEKGQYLLEAIGQKIGSAVYIKEIEESGSGFYISGASSNNIALPNRTRADAGDQDKDALSFAPIKIRYVIEAKFEIE